MRRDKLKWFVMTLCVALLAGAAVGKPLRVLILTGANNHDWRATTDSLKKTYEDSGRFEVDVTETPSELNAAAIAGHDVLVGNWTQPGDSGHLWGDAAEKAIEHFVAGGKGFVAFHAGSSCFYDWEGFHKIVGGTWGNGTGHGHYHEFQVDVVDRNHPITSGMEDFVQSDELWHKIAVLQPTPNRQVLCRAFSSKEQNGTGEMEDVAICTQYGKGRGFYTTLGHDVKAMETDGFKRLILRATEWAATANVAETPPVEWLRAAVPYTYGQSRTVLTQIEKLVRQAGVDGDFRKELAGQMAAMLGADASMDCKKFLCVQLSLIGSAAEVPALAGLLEDKELGLAARSALERIACDEALAAMRGALKKASGETASGLMAALGSCEDAAAVKVIADHLGSKDVAVAAAAIDALGKIGGMDAMGWLLKVDAEASTGLRLIISDALLNCAEKLVADGKIDETADVYRRLSDSARPAHIRLAVFPGFVAAQKGEATPALLQALTGNDPAMRAAAIRCLTIFKGEELAKAVADKLDTLPPGAQVQVVSALATRGDKAALSGMSRLLVASDESVRLAVIAALGELGDASMVSPLAAQLAHASEKEVIRESLRRLKGPGVNDAIVGLLKGGDVVVRREMATALGARGASSAVPALLEAARDADAGVRGDAMKALRVVADAKACPRLVALLSEADSDDECLGIGRALFAICLRHNEAFGQILSGFDRQSTTTKTSFLGLAGKVGGDDALKVVRAAAKDSDLTIRTAAVRAMGSWPNAAPLEDLLAVAFREKESVPKALALRGFANLSPKSELHSAKEMVGLYAQALETADRVADKRALLGGLGGVNSPTAMPLALSCLDEEEVANEAGLAVVQIATHLLTSHPNDVILAMGKVRRTCRAQAVGGKATEILVTLDKPLNLALGATAGSPDGLDKDGASSGDQAAIDGDSATYWDEVDEQSLYRLKVDFKQPTDVNVIRIEGFSQHGFAPKDFDIVCDDKVVTTVQNAVYDQNKLTVPFPVITCQSLELKITGRYGPSPAIRELEIFCVK